MMQILPKIIRNHILEYKKNLIQKGFQKPKIILFGSYAKGTNNTDSDIDLAIISTIFGRNYYQERIKLMLLSKDIDIDIEPHPYNPKDLNNKFDALANEIKKYGVEIK